MGSHHTFCRDMFRAASLVLLQDLTQAMCILIQRKKGKRVKNVISGSSFLVKCLEVQGGWLPSAGWALPGVSLFRMMEKTKFFLFQ